MSKIFAYFKAAFATITALFANTKSLVLDGTSQYVAIDTTAAIIDYTNSTIFVKFFFDSTIPFTDNQVIYGYNQSSTLKDNFYRSASTTVRWFLRYGGLIFDSGGLTPKEGWNSAAVTYEDVAGTVTAKFYLNGSLVNEVADTGTVSAIYPISYLIGNAGTNTGVRAWYYKNNIDTFVITNQAFTLDEVREMTVVNDLSQHSQYATLTHWYDFEDDSIVGNALINRIGNGLDATLVNGATNINCVPYPYPYQLETGNYTPLQNNDGGFSWDFDGVNDYINIGDVGINSGDNFTFSIWAKTNGIVCGFGTSSYLIVSSGVLKYYNGTTLIGTLSVPTNQFNMLQLSHNGSTLTLRVNGKKEIFTISLGQDIDTFRIARSVSNYGSGILDSAIFYNIELTDSQSLGIYNNHQPRNEMNESLSTNILGYWNGRNSSIGFSGVIDLSGNGNNGTMTNMTDTDIVYDFPRQAFDLVNGNGGSFNFDGINDYVSVPDAANLSFGNGTTDSPFSISVWFRLGSFVNQQQVIIKDNEYLIRINSSGRTFFELYTDTSNILVRRDSGIATPLDEWANIVCTYDGSKNNSGMKIFSNGLRVDDATQNIGVYTGMTNTANDLKIGGNTVFADGNINHATVIAKELTFCEVQELYNDGSPVDIREVTFKNDVVSHWCLDARDSPTGTVNDIVGTNNGTAINMVAGDLETDNYPTN
jgi:hypothetical protein